MAVNKELLKGSTVTLILSLLDRRPLYGYQMIVEIQNSSGGVFNFKEGTLYPILHMLESQGYVTSYWSDESEGARRRRYYQITDDGRGYLKTRLTEWALFRTAVDRVIGGTSG